MLIRLLTPEERDRHDRVVDHPVQSWQWGEFKRQSGLDVERIGFFENDTLVRAIQVTFHRLPVLGSVGYAPKSFLPDAEQLSALKRAAKQHRAIFTKLEPNVFAVAAGAVPQAGAAESDGGAGHAAPDTPQTGAGMQDAGAGHAAADAFSPSLDALMLEHDGRRGEPIYTKHDFHLDLRPDEDALFAALNSKTRYNVRLAIKKRVEIVEDSSEAGMETYIRLMLETTQRQKFYSHSPEFFRSMWRVIGRADNSMMRVFHARYADETLVAWIVFVFNGKLYYPYGASSDQHREVMASNLMMWRVIQYGKASGCTDFNMWGALGPVPDERDSFYGFHRFKQGYGSVLMENVGTYDLVYNKASYRLFGLLNNLRWRYLRLKRR
ncbi:MAG: peptidoglycan bridge formation glycyltransferase FemA/FemB family protein [Treponema sp.]|jgi:lipid II:glycine glycyltransferase (peptidoglycan interpeptide bridge formation enzyme)|nr:peptidoglycan bridge formation glycyltransferase FemA/FemB family protein [Treponema sp.]